jgi:hypothetical protein
MIRFGIIGFHLGNGVPPPPSRASRIGGSDFDLSPRVDVTELLRAAGAFLVAVAALVSVYVVVFDEVLPAIWTIIVGLCWMFGGAMQIVVGIRVRMTLAPREAAECPLLAAGSIGQRNRLVAQYHYFRRILSIFFPAPAHRLVYLSSECPAWLVL